MQEAIKHKGHHFIAIFGGSVAGSEAANQMAQRGFRVVVFDQNELPYGKIEDGLPKWHIKLRDKEERNIDDKLDQPNIRFVPGVRLGRDIDFHDLVTNWGFSAILLATGAWRDRPLPIKNASVFSEHELIYQNPFIYWFNHHHEPDYSGPEYKIKDNTVVVGGGLASLDVIKALMIELVKEALEKRGIKESLFTLEKGIDRVLEKHNLGLEDLNLKGCTLVYRRRDIDMPLTSAAIHNQEELEKAQKVRRKIMDNFVRKYLFRFEPGLTPYEAVKENGELKGLLFQKNEIDENGNINATEETKLIKTQQVISSIGSIPEKIEGIPVIGSVFDLDEGKVCRVKGYENVFAIGNSVTGRGNIKESLEHGRYTTLEVMEDHLNWMEDDFQDWLRGTEDNVEEQMESIADVISLKKFMPEDVIQSIFDKTKAMQKKAGFTSTYRNWISSKIPVRLEEIEETKT